MLLKHFGTISRNLLSRKEMLAEVQVLVVFLPGSRIIHCEASKVL